MAGKQQIVTNGFGQKNLYFSNNIFCGITFISSDKTETDVDDGNNQSDNPFPIVKL